MSKILIPFIDHTSINHKIYLRQKLTNGDEKSTCFWTGIYPELPINKLDYCAKFADKLLYYDTSIITTDDFLFLVSVLGFKIVNELLDDRAIEIYNNRSCKTSISTMATDEPFILNFSFDRKIDSEEKILEYQRNYRTVFEAQNRSQMLKIIDDAKLINIDDDWINLLNNETASDLMNVKIIGKLGLINDGKIIDRDHDYNQFLYNRIAYLNLYMALGKFLSLNNILLPEDLQKLLDVKLGAYIRYNSSIEHKAYSSITKYAGITDIYKLLQDNTIDYSDIIKIRKHKHSGEFRKWLESLTKSSLPASSNEVVDYVQLYNNAVKEGVKLERKAETILTKSIKFAIPTILGSIPIPEATIVSELVSASLFINDIFEYKFRPNVFIDDCLGGEIGKKINQKMLYDENAYYIYLHGKIPLNVACPCGSGVKYNKCHGLYR